MSLSFLAVKMAIMILISVRMLSSGKRKVYSPVIADQ